MQTFPAAFTTAHEAAVKYPYCVIAIVHETDSIYLTTHAGIADLPVEDPIEGVIKDVSAISQKVYPDEGRSEIGAMTFDAIDIGGALTEAFRTKLAAGDGLRGKTVRLHVGYAGMSFDDFQQFQTQVVQSVTYRDAVYSFRCADITREQRKEIFDPKVTTLATSISASDTTIEVFDTAAFELVEHGTSYSDAPSSTVGYIRIEDEKIRYTGKTGTTFTGCTRGALNTRAVPHAVDVTEGADQRTKVEEYIYLEMPGVKLALAILTGELYDQSASLPAHWHLGIDAGDWVREADFTGIGVDLWDPADDEAGFVPVFNGMKKIDGKRFLEKEIYQLLGCYPMVYADGKLGLRRMNQVLVDAAAVMELNETNVASWSALEFDMQGMHNTFRVAWNYVDTNGKTEFTRQTVFVDAESQAIHGTTEVKVLEFRGLYGSRHTVGQINQRISALRDRYSHPPERLTLDPLPSKSKLEVGDVVRVKLPAIRDFAGTTDSIDRSMEIQNKTYNQLTGELKIVLFGSTGRASAVTPTDEESALPDTFYDDKGTELSTVVDITGGATDAGSFNLDGHDDLNHEDAIYYYIGDLEISSDTIINITKNVQLRVMGFLTINGDIVGTCEGPTGATDDGTPLNVVPGTAGFVGTTRAWDGVNVFQKGGNPVMGSINAPVVSGAYTTVPYITLSVSGDELLGLPSNLQGTSGGAGGKSLYQDSDIRAAGGAGGAAGAGLCIISRGLAFGASGSVELSGCDGSAGGTWADGPRNWSAGPGSPGGPGAFLILLDGSGHSVPDLGGRFFALTGDAPVPYGGSYSMLPFAGAGRWAKEQSPWVGYQDLSMVAERDLSNACFRVQFIPSEQTAAEDAPIAVPAPTNLTATGVANGISLLATLPPFDSFDSVEFYAATTNDRTTSTLIQEIKASAYTHPLAPATTRYYWIRCQRGAQLSEWYPVSETGGVSGTAS